MKNFKDLILLERIQIYIDLILAMKIKNRLFLPPELRFFFLFHISYL